MKNVPVTGTYADGSPSPSCNSSLVPFSLGGKVCKQKSKRDEMQKREFVQSAAERRKDLDMTSDWSKRGSDDKYKPSKKYLRFNQHSPCKCVHGVFIGATGAGKTFAAFNVLEKIMYFDNLLICAPTDNQREFKVFADKINNGKYGRTVTFESDLDKVAEYVNACTKDTQNFVMFDDCMLKAQDKIVEVFIAGRHNGVQCFILSQSYFQTPKVIRLQCGILVMMPDHDPTDLAMIARQRGIGKPANFIGAYKSATARTPKPGCPGEEECHNFFYVDMSAPTGRRYRRNGKDYLPPTLGL